jgi:hypothetical protein
VTSADEMYGPITTLQRDKQPVKHIPWAAFKMVEADWKRVVDARDILGVSPVIFILLERLTYRSLRIQTVFSNTSPLRRSQHSGVPYLPSRNFKQHGKRSVIVQNMHYIRMRSLMVWQKWVSITPVSTRSLALFSHSVSLRNKF